MASTSAKFGFIKGSPIIDVAELPNPVTNSAINPTGTYDKVWFNTNLSYEEFANIASQIDFAGSNTYFLFIDNTIFAHSPCSLGVYKDSDGFELVVCFNEDGIVTTVLDSNGWKSDIANPYEFGVLCKGLEVYAGNDIGTQNDLLKDFVYIEEVNENAVNTKALYRLPDGTLWHYNGQWNAVGSGGVEEGATAIEPTGTYDKLYINTSLSFEEINSMLDKLNIENGMTYAGYLSFNSNDEPQNGIAIIKLSGVYSVSVIVDGIMVGLISIHDGVTVTQDWLDFENPLSVNLSNGLLENPSVEGQLVGNKNDLIKDFISATPFDNATNFAILSKRINSLEVRIKALEEA